MNESEKSIAQLAYETFIVGLAAIDAEEAKHAPPWAEVPDAVRLVIAEAVGAAVRSFAPALSPETSPEDQTFGQLGYQAYIESTGGLNYQGLPCPEWSKMADSIRAAWAAAALRVRTEHEHRFAGDYDLAVSEDELKELIAGLDALQISDKHQAELLMPLRSRLRALAFPPEPAPEDEDDEEPEPKSLPAPSDTPLLETSNEDAKQEPAAPDPVPNLADLSEHGKAWHNAKRSLAGLPPLEPTDSAPESPSPEPGADAPATEPAELPAVSEGPAGPGFEGLEPVIPAAAPLPTYTDAPATEPSEASAPDSD